MQTCLNFALGSNCVRNSRTTSMNGRELDFEVRELLFESIQTCPRVFDLFGLLLGSSSSGFANFVRTQLANSSSKFANFGSNMLELFFEFSNFSECSLGVQAIRISPSGVKPFCYFPQVFKLCSNKAGELEFEARGPLSGRARSCPRVFELTELFSRCSRNACFPSGFRTCRY